MVLVVVISLALKQILTMLLNLAQEEHLRALMLQLVVLLIHAQELLLRAKVLRSVELIILVKIISRVKKPTLVVQPSLAQVLIRAMVQVMLT